MYTEGIKDCLEKEREERKSRINFHAEFSPKELALATIPGVDFDPTRRQFSNDELKPKPINKRRKRVTLNILQTRYFGMTILKLILYNDQMTSTVLF